MSGSAVKVNRADITVVKPFVYGSAASWLGKQSEEEHSHRWTVYLRGLENEDLSYYIKKVSFHLHQSFKEPIRVIEKPPFEVTETGWGEFSIQLVVEFHDIREQPVTLSHLLRLFPEGGGPNSRHKPVMAESYDEFVFTNPTEALHTLLMSGAKQKFDNHPLNQWFTTPQLVEKEQTELDQLARASKMVTQKIEDLRKQLFAAETEIASMSGAIPPVGIPQMITESEAK